MKFIFECEDLDGLVLIDREYIDELDDQLLYDFDVCLDRKGKSELVYDFPNKKWNDVYNEAFYLLEKYCATGKMVLFLLDKDNYDCIVSFSDEEFDTESYIDIKSGHLVIVSASELIQCATYKDLEMETILELDNVKKGKYAVKNNNIYNIILKNIDKSPEVIRNIVVL